MLSSSFPYWFSISTVVCVVALPFRVISAPTFPDFQPCPILGHAFPLPAQLPESEIIVEAMQTLKSNFTDSVRHGTLADNPVTPNTTSFSVSVFSTEDTSEKPYFFEYHHTASAHNASAEGSKTVDADSIYRIGSLTQVFTVWTFLIEAGEGHWHESIPQYVPELAQAVKDRDPAIDPVANIDWNAVTLGDLAGHLAGLPRDYSNSNSLSGGPQLGLTSLPNIDELACGTVDQPCSRKEFFAGISNAVPVYTPGNTPIFSDAAFQILAYALEALTSKPFSSLLTESLLRPLNLTSTSLNPPSDLSRVFIPSNTFASGFTTNFGDSAAGASGGLYSTIHDISLAGSTILRSDLLPRVITNRWLKPISSTSNIANIVGRPWTIFSNRLYRNAGPVIDIYTQVGSIGQYSSYLGLAPDFGVGFAILAADASAETGPDLNAYADAIGAALVPALVKTSLEQATLAYAGEYLRGDNSLGRANAHVKIEVPTEMPQLGGLALTEFSLSEKDAFQGIAEAYGIEKEKLSVRLYPTDLRTDLGDGRYKVAFRAVVEDMGASADAGTPTCISWQGVGARTRGNVVLDRVEFVIDRKGSALSVGLPAFGLDGLGKANERSETEG